jgi:hypothetical protein
MRRTIPAVLALLVGVGVGWVLRSPRTLPGGHPEEIVFHRPGSPATPPEIVRLRVVRVSPRGGEPYEVAKPRGKQTWRVQFPDHSLYAEPVASGERADQ